MKIVFVAQPFDGMEPPVRVGSLALWIYYTAQHLATRGHSATIIGNNGKRLSARIVEHEKVRHVLTPTLIDAQIDRAGRLLFRARTKLRLKTTNYVYAGWHHLPFALLAARTAAVERAEVVHIMNYSQFVPLVKRWNPGAVVALHMQCEWLTQFPSEVIRPRLQQTDLIIGCSQYITDLISGRFPEFADKCVTVPNAAEKVPAEAAASPTGHRVLFVGRLSPEKGVHDLITAFHSVLTRVPDATLHLVGSPGSVPLEYLVGLSDDPHVQALRSFYERSRQDSAKDFYLEAIEELAGPELGHRIFFEGYADHHVIREHYMKAAVLVNPSLSESFGISLVEAMMMKIPVVATRVGGMQHTVIDGQTGFLIDPADPEALARAIVNVLINPELAGRLGESGCTRAHEHFSWESTTDNLVTAYANARKRSGFSA